MHGLKRQKYPSLTERITRARGQLHHEDGVTQIVIETDAVSGLEQPAQMGICGERARQETNKKYDGRPTLLQVGNWAALVG